MFKGITTWAELHKAGFTAIGATGTPSHFEAIARFLLAVSNDIDAHLNACLQLQINSDEEAVTRILVGEMRVGDVTGALTRIATARKLDAKFLRSMSDLFSEISTLRHVRDIAVHRACMVNGDKLAFHNAFLAKTESAIEVDFYTIGELNEFVAYAKRLGYRVMRLNEFLIPIHMPQEIKAYLAMATQQVAMTLHVGLLDTGVLTGEKRARLKLLSKRASDAIKAYADEARKSKVDFSKLQQVAIEASLKYVTAIALIIAPDDSSLLEIPVRLRKKERARQKGISRVRAHQPQSSRA